MHIPKQYFHDKFVLVLASTNVFLAVLSVALLFIRFGGGTQAADSYIIQYRESLGSINPFFRGGIASLFSFAVFALLVLVFNILLSLETYSIKRALSLTILSLGILILLLCTIVSNALLSLY